MCAHDLRRWRGRCGNRSHDEAHEAQPSVTAQLIPQKTRRPASGMVRYLSAGRFDRPWDPQGVAVVTHVPSSRRSRGNLQLVDNTCNKSKKWKERKMILPSHCGAEIKRRQMTSSRGKLPCWLSHVGSGKTFATYMPKLVGKQLLT